MGLIKMVTGTVGSTFRDAVKDYYRCDGMTNDILVMPAAKVLRDGTVNNASDRVISDGSVFDVAVGQAALLLENGKVHDFVLATENSLAGQYRYDSKVEPSFLAAAGIKEALLAGIEVIKNRFPFGGQSSNTINIVYVNLKEIVKNPVGFGKTPFKDKYLGTRLMLAGHGFYTFKIVDPMAFYENLVMDYNKKYDKTDLTEQMRQELQPVLMEAIGTIAPECEGGYDDILTKRKQLAEIVNDNMDEAWKKRGISLEEISITPTLSEEDTKRVMELENAKTLSNTGMAMGSMVNAQNQAMQNAASNANGAMAGFMGMGFAQNAGGFQANTLVQQQMEMEKERAKQQAAVEASKPVAASAATWTCECGTENTGNFCQNCGKKHPVVSTWVCECGTENTGNFCQNCGKKKAEKKFCPNCGNELSNGEKFCPNCGTKME